MINMMGHRGIVDQGGAGSFLPFHLFINSPKQGIPALAPVGNRLDNRGARQLRQLIKVKLDFLFFCLIRHIEGDDQFFIHLQQLSRQIKTPFDIAGFNYIDDDIRVASQYVVPGHDLIFGKSSQAVNTGQVNHLVKFTLILEATLLFLNGYPRPVPYMLCCPRQAIE